MAKVIYKNGQTSVILRVKIMDSTSTTGGAKTGLTNASTGLIVSTIADNEATATAYTAAGSTIDGITTLGTFAAPTSGHCRFKEVDSTNHPGLYEIQIADARWAVSGAKSIIVTVSGPTGAAQVDAEIQLSSADLNDGVRLNLTAIPNVASGSAGAIPTTGTGANQISVSSGQVILQAGTGTGQLDFTSGVVKANLAQILGTALTETAGYLAAAFKKFFNIGSPTLTTGGTDQTGDSFARLGAPAGASIAADIAEIEAETDGIAAIPTSNPSAASIATALWTDLLSSSDFTTAGSIGQKLASIKLDGSGDVYAVDQFGNQLAGAAQVSNIAVTAAALNQTAASVTMLTGTDFNGVSQTTGLDGSYDVWQHSGGAIRGYYQFDLSATPGGTATGVQWWGYFTGSPAIVVSAYNWGAAGWDTLGSVPASTSNVDVSFDLTNSHTGTGANAGQVRIMFQAMSGAVNFNTDRILVGYAVVLTPPAHWSSMAIDASGNVTVGAYASGNDPYTLVMLPANGIETGVSPKQAIQRIGATTAGKISGSQSGNPSTEIFVGLDGATTRVTVTADSSGNRTNVVYS